MKNNVTTSSSLSEFRAHLTAGSRAVFAGIISSRLHCEQIRGLSTHTYTHLFTVTHPSLLCHDPHQHVSNPTVAFGSSGEARATKMGTKYLHALFTVKSVMAAIVSTRVLTGEYEGQA